MTTALFALLALSTLLWAALAIRLMRGGRVAVDRVQSAPGQSAPGQSSPDLSSVAPSSGGVAEALRDTPGANFADQSFSDLPYPAWISDTDGQLLAVNAAYCRLVEAPDPHMVVSQQLHLLETPRTDFGHFFEGNDTAFRERRSAIIEGRRRSLAVSIVRFGAGHFLHTAVDVTGEEEALAELARVLEAQAETLDRLKSPVAIFGADKILRFFNNAFQQLTGLTEKELEGIDHSALLDAMRAHRRLPEQPDFAAWKASRLEKYHSLREAEEENWFLADGTSYRTVEQPYPFGGLLVLLEDITDKLELERSYNTLLDVQRETLDNMDEGVAVFRENGTLSFYNAAFVNLMALPPESLEGNPKASTLIAHLPVKEGDAAGLELQQALPIWLSEVENRQGRWQRADGRRLDYKLSRLPDGGSLMTQIDVTDSARIETALRERNMALRAADQLRSGFVSSVSYELRTPLNSVIGFGEILKAGIAGGLNDQQLGYVDDILASAEDLRRMISDVLDMAALESGKFELTLDPVQLDVVAARSVPLLGPTYARKNISVETRVADMPPVMGDFDRLQQALYALLTVLVRFTPKGGHMLVQASAEAESVSIAIEVPNCDTPRTCRDEALALLAGGSTELEQQFLNLNITLTRRILALHQATLELAPVGPSGLVASMTFTARDVSESVSESTI